MPVSYLNITEWDLSIQVTSLHKGHEVNQSTIVFLFYQQNKNYVLIDSTLVLL